jgi:hypothetical protein
MNVLVGVTITIPFLVFAWRRSHSKKYPPGPKRLPLLGNLLDIPRRHAHEKFAKYSKELGEFLYKFITGKALKNVVDSDIIYIDAAGTPIIILNSLEACNDLLEKRSTIYSSRYHQTMAYEL